MQPVVAKLVGKKLHAYMAVVVIFSYSVLLSRDFECTCKAQRYDCMVYLVIPALIVTVLMLWSNRLLHRFCTYCCMFKGFVLCQILKSALVGLLWVSFLFIEGEWFACCLNNLSEEQASLPCKAAGLRTDEERAVIAVMKNTSRVIGCWLLFMVISSGAMISWVRWKCDGACSCSKQSAQYEETLYYKLVLEEEEKVLKEVLRESINIKLTAEIRKNNENNWKECFKVTSDFLQHELKQTANSKQNKESKEPREEVTQNLLEEP